MTMGWRSVLDKDRWKVATNQSSRPNLTSMDDKSEDLMSIITFLWSVFDMILEFSEALFNWLIYVDFVIVVHKISWT